MASFLSLHVNKSSALRKLALLSLGALLLVGNVSTLSVVVQKLLNQIDVGEHHPSAAVPPQAELVHGIALGVVGLEEVQVGLPLVADDLSARETPNGDNHGDELIIIVCAFEVCWQRSL